MSNKPAIYQFSVTINISNNFPSSLDEVQDFTKKLCQKLELNIVTGIHHEFKPSGITLVYILSQSHIAIHTWPEYNLIHIEIVSCKEINKVELENEIKSLFADGLVSLEIK